MRWVAWLTNGDCVEQCDDVFRMKKDRMPWSMLKERCAREGLAVSCLALECPDGRFVALPRLARGYWHACALHAHSNSPGEDYRSCGVGWVCGGELWIVWGHVQERDFHWLTCERRRDLAAQGQIIWAPGERPHFNNKREKAVALDGRAVIRPGGRVLNVSGCVARM